MTHALGFILQMYTSAFVNPPYCLAADVPGMQVHMARDSLEISSGERKHTIPMGSVSFL